MAERRTIQTDYLARVEGEGAMTIRLHDGEVEHVELRIFEPPRFFEALLRGRSFLEAPDITARICGICPVAYQMSAVQAMEDVCGVVVPEPLQLLRRLLYCGEWIESHALHVYMLHAPDFLGYESAIELAQRRAGSRRARPGAEEDGQPGDDARRRPGGAPDQRPRRRLLPRADAARAAARSSSRSSGRARRRSRRCAGRRASSFPSARSTCELVALSHPGDYAIERGRVVSDRGLDIAVSEYDEHFVEEHVERSNALQSRRRRRRHVPLRPARALRAQRRAADAALPRGGA